MFGKKIVRKVLRLDKEQLKTSDFLKASMLMHEARKLVADVPEVTTELDKVINTTLSVAEALSQLHTEQTVQKDKAEERKKRVKIINKIRKDIRC